MHQTDNQINKENFPLKNPNNTVDVESIDLDEQQKEPN
jgi:hypothetical protein